MAIVDCLIDLFDIPINFRNSLFFEFLVANRKVLVLKEFDAA